MILICSVHVSFVSTDVAPDGLLHWKELFSFLENSFNWSTFCEQFVLLTIFKAVCLFVSKKWFNSKCLLIYYNVIR